MVAALVAVRHKHVAHS